MRRANVVAHETIYPHTGGRKAEEAGGIVLSLVAALPV